MADNIIIKLGVDLPALQRSLRNAQREMKQFGQNLQRIGRDLTTYITLPLVGIGATSLKTAADFEQAMNGVRAITQASGKEFAQLRDLAREMGRTTVFSAVESANAIEMLAKNGLSARQIMNGALKASLSLAAATGTDLATAADISTDAMHAFGLQTKDLEKVMDSITGATIKSKFGIEDYALALGQSGGVAGSLGVSLSDFNTTLAATSSLFKSGSDAGTSLRTFLTRLTPQSKEAAVAMRELGLEFFDINGNMKGMAEISESLKRAFSGLTEEQRTAYATTIFGQDAMRTAFGLAKIGANNFRELARSIGQVSAADQAATRLSGLNGQIKLLQSAIQELQISISEAGLLGAARELIQTATKITNKFAALEEQTKQNIIQFSLMTAAIGPLAIAVGKIVSLSGSLVGVLNTIGASVSGFKALSIAVKGLNTSLLATTGTVGMYAAGAAALVLIGKSLYDTYAPIRQVFAKMVEWGTAAFKALGDLAVKGAEILSSAFEPLLSAFEPVLEALGVNTEAALKTLRSAMDKTKQVFDSASDQLSLDELWKNIKSNFSSGLNFLSEGAKAVIEPIIEQFSKLDNMFEGVASKMKRSEGELGASNSFIQPLEMGGVTTSPIQPPAIQGLSEQFLQQKRQVDELAESYRTAQESISESSNMIAESVGNAFGQMIGEGKSIGDAIRGVLKSIISSLVAAAVKAIAAGEAINKSLSGFGAIALAAGAAAAASAFFGGMPAFADGGIVKGPTMGIVGEYAGASTNPEVISPLSELDSKIRESVRGEMRMGGNGMQGGQKVEISLKTSEILIGKEDLRIVLQEAIEDYNQKFG